MLFCVLLIGLYVFTCCYMILLEVDWCEPNRDIDFGFASCVVCGRGEPACGREALSFVAKAIWTPTFRAAPAPAPSALVGALSALVGALSALVGALSALVGALSAPCRRLSGLVGALSALVGACRCLSAACRRLSALVGACERLSVEKFALRCVRHCYVI